MCPRSKYEEGHEHGPVGTTRVSLKKNLQEWKFLDYVAYTSCHTIIHFGMALRLQSSLLLRAESTLNSYQCSQGFVSWIIRVCKDRDSPFPLPVTVPDWPHRETNSPPTPPIKGQSALFQFRTAISCHLIMHFNRERSVRRQALQYQKAAISSVPKVFSSGQQR